MVYEKIFSQIGLTEQEAIIYEIMLELGEARAKEIYQKSPFKRGLVYKLLDNLIEKHLIVRIDKPGKISIFRVEHPDKINDLVEAQERKVRHYKKSIHSLMPELISNYNLAFNKPGIKFYEGLDGIRKVINDVFTSKEIVYTFIDIEKIEQDPAVKELNIEHTKKRRLKGLQKKILVPDTPFSREKLKNYNPEVTEIRILPENEHFESSMQIYSNKISYVTVKKDSLIGVILEDESTYIMHRKLFEVLWKNSLPLTQNN